MTHTVFHGVAWLVALATGSGQIRFHPRPAAMMAFGFRRRRVR